MRVCLVDRSKLFFYCLIGCLVFFIGVKRNTPKAKRGKGIANNMNISVVSDWVKVFSVSSGLHDIVLSL